ncbi:MAG: C1 family peptidase [Candidatus Sericytochromatia bacterium]
MLQPLALALSLWGVNPDLPPATGLQFLPPEQLRAIPLAELPYAGFELPAAVDLSEHMPTPGFQGRQNSCVAWASTYAVKTYQEKLEQRYQLISQGKPDWERIFSPAFVYNQINQGRDGGATLVDALNLLSGQGAVSWAAMPYHVGNYLRQPTSAQLQAARRYRIAYWRQVNVADPYELKAQLQAGYPVMIGALIDESLHKLERGAVWKQAGGRKLGGHALVVVGYDDRRKAFKVMNSWGPRWADGGFGWIDYRHFARVVREGYVAKDARNVPLREASLSDTLRSEGADTSASPSRPAADQGPMGQLNKTAQAMPAPASPPLYVQAEEEAFLPVEIATYRLHDSDLAFSGTAYLPEQQGEKVKVLVRLFADAAGERPLHSSDPRYALPDGSAVATADDAVFAQRVSWQAHFPRVLLPAGLRQIWARPVVYVDRFGVEAGPLLALSLSEASGPLSE